MKQATRLFVGAVGILGCASTQPFVLRSAPGSRDSLQCAETVLGDLGFELRRGERGAVMAEKRHELGPARARRDFVTVEQVTGPDAENRFQVRMASYSYEPPLAESRFPQQAVSTIRATPEALDAGERVLAACERR